MILRLLSAMGNRRHLVRFCALLAITGLLEGTLYLVLVPITEALVQNSPQDMWRWVLVGLGLALAFGGCFLLTQAVAASTIAKTGLNLRQQLGRHVLRLPLSWFTGNRRGSFARQVSSDATQVAVAAAGIVPSAILSFAAPVATLVVSVVLDWRFAVIFAVMLGTAIFYIAKILPKTKSIQQSFDDAANELAGRAIEFAQAQVLLRASRSTAETNVDTLGAAFRQQRQAYRKSLRHSLIPQLVYAGIIQGGILLMLLLSVSLAIEDPARIPALIALLILVARFAEPLSNLVGTLGAVISAHICLDNIESTLHTPSLSEGNVEVVNGHEITFKDVDFSYRPGKPVLQGTTFTIPTGSMVAVSGESGAGKSTILRLIARAWDPNAGQILIGGVDTRTMRVSRLFSRLTLAAQQSYLFDDSIKNNVLSGNPKATDKQLEQVAYITRLDEIVARVPEGWQFRVGEKGSRLSGGERQRVALARALIKDAPIILLDEATSALDAKNEQLVCERLHELTRTSGRTIIMVTHHPSVMALADSKIEVR